MARKRDDDELEPDEVAEEADEIAEEAAEAEDAEAADADDAEAVEADADSDVAEAEDDAEAEESKAADEFEEAEADADDVGEEEPYEEEKPKPKPKITGLTLTLCILNVAAALGFLYLLMLDYSKRNSYTYAAAQHEFPMAGVGTNEDRHGITAGVETLPKPKLSHDALNSAFRARGGSGTTGSFTPVEDGIRYQLYGMPPELLKQELKDVGDPVATVEEEMKRLQGKLPGDIQAVVAKQSDLLKKATDAEKQKKLAMLLYPLCRTRMQVEKLDAKIKRAQGAALDSMVADAVERRILADILLPVEMFRSSDTEDATLEKVSDAGDVPIDVLRKLMDRRLEAAAKETHDGAVHFGKEWDNQKRWTIEKRQNAAFLLLSLAYARNHLTPLAKEDSPFLYPNGIVRAVRISGLYDFTTAAKAYNDALRKWEERVVAAIALDRDGFHIVGKNNEIKRSESFAEQHAALQFRIRQVQTQIRAAQARIQDIDQQIDRAKKLVDVRTKDLAEVESRIKQERAITKKRIAELRQLQDQLFENQKILATAAEINARLEAEIRALSGVKAGVKGD
jgi:hypothetical protein